MRKILILVLVFILTLTLSITAQESKKLTNNQNQKLNTVDNLDLSQDKEFSDSAREELLGIASKYDDQSELDELTVGRTDRANLNLLSDQILSSYTYSLDSASNLSFNQNYEDKILGDKIKINNPRPVSNVFYKKSNNSKGIGLTYKTNDKLTLSADFIENDRFTDYKNDENLNTNTSIFGVEYNDSLGTFRASYQLDSSDDLNQRITGLEFDFNNLATFSASYKLLDPKDLESTLESQTAWDLGLGLNINEKYGLNFGYEIIEDKSGELKTENEKNIKASFEIDF